MISFVENGAHLSIKDEPWKVARIISASEVEIRHLITGVLGTYTRKQFLADFLTEECMNPSPFRGNDNEFWLLSDWDEKTQEKVRYRMKWVLGVDNNHIPKSKKKLESFITSYSKEIEDVDPPSYKTISNWHTKWVNAGRNPIALVSGDNIRKGSIRIQRDLNKLILQGIEKIYFAGPEMTVGDVADWVEGEVLKDEYRHLSEEKVSKSTIERRINAIDEFERVARKFGRKYAINLFNSRKNVTVPSRILEVVEIDETWADIFVISEDGTPLGRPNFTFVVDVYSRMILAIHISFIDPSAATTLHAIKQAILPKNHILEQLTYIKEDWPAYGIPEAIKSDNISHFLSDDFLTALSELMIDHLKCPVGKPNFKGIVERLFGKVSRYVLSKSSGYAKPLKQRFTELDLDPEKTAVFTIDEVREIIFKYFIDIYSHNYQDALEGTPAQLWNESMEQFGVRMDQPLAKIELALRNTSESTIQNGGLTFEHIQYDSDELQRLRQRLKQRRIDISGRNPMVSYKYSIDDLGKIYVKDPESKKYICVHAVDQAYASGLTYHQHKEIRKILNARRTQVVSNEKLRRAKAELIEMCLGIKSDHKPLLPRKKIAKMEERQFGSVGDAALSMLSEFDSESVYRPVELAEPPTVTVSTGVDEIFAEHFELGDDDV